MNGLNSNEELKCILGAILLTGISISIVLLLIEYFFI